MTVHRILAALVMVGAVLAVTLPPLAPKPWRMGAAVLAFVLAGLAYLRFRGATGRSALVWLGLAFLALSFAVPGAGLGGGLAGAGAVILVNAWTGKTGEDGKL